MFDRSGRFAEHLGGFLTAAKSGRAKNFGASAGCSGHGEAEHRNMGIRAALCGPRPCRARMMRQFVGGNRILSDQEERAYTAVTKALRRLREAERRARRCRREGARGRRGVAADREL